jgi:succinyl-diaminopimelate desuccinylase
MIDQLLECLREQQDEMVRDLIELIGIPSVTANRAENRRALFWLLEKAAQQGMKTCHTPEEDCGIIEIGAGEETIGILTHVDVVEAGDRQKWQTDPFTGVFDGQWITGRGAMDDKGPTIVIYTILRLMHRLNLPLKKRIRLIIGTREESSWTDMDHFRQAFPAPDYGFTPDGAFPVHHIENGYADVRLTFKVEQLPAHEIVVLAAGDSENTIPSKAVMTLKTDSEASCQALAGQLEQIIAGNEDAGQLRTALSACSATCAGKSFSLRAKGVSSHSSLPQNGVNAISLIMLALAELDREAHLLPPSFKRMVDLVRLTADCHDGSALGFDNSPSMYQGEDMGENVVVPTILSLENGSVILNLNIRHRVGMTREDLEKQFRRLSREYGCVFKIQNYQDPLYVSRDLPFFAKMHQAYEQVTGQKSAFALAGGTSYAKALPNMVSWGPVFPGETDTCHQENERIRLDSLMKATEIYARCLVSDAVKAEEEM